MRPERWLFTIPLRLRSLFRWAQADQELDDELRDHLERRTEEYVAQGMAPKEAQRRARLDLGGIQQTKEKCRDARRVNWIQDFVQDLRFGLRMLRKSLGFTVVAVLTLAVGIGANTAIFSVVNAVLLRPLPYPHPDRLVTVSESNLPNDAATRNAVAPGNFLDWRQRNDVFEQTVAVDFPGFTLTGSDRPERMLGAAVSAGTLHMLGLRPALGREFSAEDDRAGASRVVMLSYALWQRRFAGDRRVIGKTLRLGLTPYTIVGVLPRGLTFPDPDAALWVPLEQSLSPEDMHWRNSHYLDVYARLKPGVTLARARAEMNDIAAKLKRENPDTNSGAATFILPLQQDLTGDIRPALLTLLVAVGFVLLIACANVANLLLARAAARGKELTMRRALGARRWRLVRQLLTESVLLSLAGGAAGLVVAGWTRQALLALRPDSLPQFNTVETDGGVLLFTLTLSLATGILFGMAPAMRGAGQNLNLALQSAADNATTGKGSRRLRHAFVVAEIAISLVLLAGAGLTLRSFVRLLNSDLGFRTDHTVTARVNIPSDKYPDDAQVTTFCDRLLARVRSTPGVESAGMTSFLPLTGHNFDNSFDVVGRPPRPASDRQYALARFVDPQFFGVLGIPLLRGRGIEKLDRQGSPRAIVISESMARSLWPHGDPIGQHLLVYLGMDESPWQIVGVVGDVRSDIAASPEPTMYFPYAQMPYRFMVLAVRTHEQPAAMEESIRNTVRGLDADEPIYQVRTLAQLLDQTLVPWRFSMTLLGIFAGIALVLAAVGIYAVMAFSVTQRMHEIGLRVALGAQRRDVMRMILEQGTRLALLGAAIGVLAALALTRLMAGLLFGVTATDPVTFAAVALVLISVALAACYIPARRAMKVDPMVALRYE